MIPLTILYDEYIGRPKLTEQKKPSWVYSSSLPTKVGVGTIGSPLDWETDIETWLGKHLFNMALSLKVKNPMK